MSGVELTGIAVALLAAGIPVAAFAGYLLLLAVAAARYRPPETTAAPDTKLVVLVPAHNEALLIARCVSSLLEQSYPRDRYGVCVVADNCSDDTAALAAGAGATVLERHEPDAPGKGRALRWAIERLLVEDPAAAAVVVVDADSIADRDFLSRITAPLADGASAVQGESLLYNDGGIGTELRVAAFLLINRVRPYGRLALGLPALQLSGNGMLLTRAQLERRPWGAFSSTEDIEYSIDLQLDGVRIRFAPRAVLLSPTAPNARAAAHQQLRWEGGKAHLIRGRVPKLVATGLRRRDPLLLLTAFELSTPPLGFLVALAFLGTVASVAVSLLTAVSAWAVAPWLLASAAIPLFVLVGLRAAEAPRSAYRALIGAPRFVLVKLLTTRRVLGFRSDVWVRTERAARPEVGVEP